MDHSQVIKDSLREELDKFDTYLKQSIQNENPRITRMVEHVFSAEGKRIRPMLVFLAAKACGKITPETYHGAVTVELLHTATLIHDDVVDDSAVRRGQASVNSAFGNHQAVLIGDYFLSSALRESVKTQDLEIVDIIAELGQNLSEGELNQYAIASEIIIDEEEYFRVIDNKTASLLYACTKIGAITAGAGRMTIEEFGRLGRILGISFQIRDDIFDYYKADVGKPTGNDLREGKITLPLIYALRTAPKELSEKMSDIIHAQNFSDDNIFALLEFAKRNGGIEYAYKKMDEYLSEAEEIITNFPFNADIKILMQLLLLYLKDRKF